MTPRRLLIAIDGPAGAGKSTVARTLAARLGYALLDTGAIYRSVALLAREQGIDWGDERSLAELARLLDLRFGCEGGAHRVSIGSRDVTEAIRRPEIAEGASRVSALPGVRQALLEVQRRLAAGGGVVAEGRDMGTVVFPGADLKVFLTASPEARARRRFEEEREKGHSVTLEQTLEDIERRDARDTLREAAPLRQADGALLVDSTDLGPEEVVARLVAAVEALG